MDYTVPTDNDIRERQISIAAQAYLAAHLKSTAMTFGEYDFPSVAQKAKIANNLYAQCLDDLLLRAMHESDVTI